MVVVAGGSDGKRQWWKTTGDVPRKARISSRFIVYVSV